MKTIEIYWQDLTKAAQDYVREELGMDENDDGNWTYSPMFTMEVETEEDKDS